MVGLLYLYAYMGVTMSSTTINSNDTLVSGIGIAPISIPSSKEQSSENATLKQETFAQLQELARHNYFKDKPQLRDGCYFKILGHLQTPEAKSILDEFKERGKYEGLTLGLADAYISSSNYRDALEVLKRLSENHTMTYTQVHEILERLDKVALGLSGLKEENPSPPEKVVVVKRIETVHETPNTYHNPHDYACPDCPITKD